MKKKTNISEEERIKVVDSLGDALVRNRDLRLPVESDLAFWSFVKAWDILTDHVINIGEESGTPCRNIFYELEVHLNNYHEAFLLSLASKMNVCLNNEFKNDEWAINACWYNPQLNQAQSKRIWSPGA